MGLKSFLSGLFGKEPAESALSGIASDLINGRYVAGSVNTDQYLEFLSKYDQKELTHQSLGNSSRIVNTSASNIHDVDLFGSSREAFWNHHGHTKADYHELASHIPEVQSRLNAGESLSSIRQDPKIGKCAELYFEPKNMPQVSQYKDTYISQGDNRHRILAAQEQGYDIPVNVVGEYTSVEQQVTVDDQEEETVIEEEVVVEEEIVEEEVVVEEETVVEEEVVVEEETVVEEEMEVNTEIEVEAEAPAATEDNSETQDYDYDNYYYNGY
jgi:hypothetical protein